jgi:multiple sugar transport system permease protein
MPGHGRHAHPAIPTPSGENSYALVLTRSRAMMAPVAIVNFMNYEGWEWGKIGAGGTMIMLPVVLFALVVRRYLLRGLTTGALKG